MSKQPAATSETFREIFDFFDAPVMQVDCGQRCKKLNDGVPVCCDTTNAVPIMQKPEYALLRSRSDLWHPFRPVDAATRAIVAGLHHTCKAVECKGHTQCERENRSLACRAFPFFPYFTARKKIAGLTYSWIFEDRCWVVANLKRVEQPFITECLRAYDVLFRDDPLERDTLVDHSASMRRVYTRKGRAVPVIGPNREFLFDLPRGGGLKRVSQKEFTDTVKSYVDTGQWD